jgi:hypothetical protein
VTSFRGGSVHFKIPKGSTPFTPAQLRTLFSIPISFALTHAQHVELEQLVPQPNKLLARFKQIVEGDNLPGLVGYIDWFFLFGRNAILKEIIRQLRLPTSPPPPPPPARCCF